MLAAPWSKEVCEVPGLDGGGGQGTNLLIPPPPEEGAVHEPRLDAQVGEGREVGLDQNLYSIALSRLIQRF